MRQKTDSITHLVKIVAGEVFDEMFNQKLTLFNETVKPTTTIIQADDYIKSLVSSVQKAGHPWLPEEDSLLDQEVRAAIAQIAMNHKRSIGAIKSRISSKQLMLG